MPGRGRADRGSVRAEHADDLGKAALAPDLLDAPPRASSIASSRRGRTSPCRHWTRARTVTFQASRARRLAWDTAPRWPRENVEVVQGGPAFASGGRAFRTAVLAPIDLRPPSGGFPEEIRRHAAELFDPRSTAPAGGEVGGSLQRWLSGHRPELATDLRRSGEFLIEALTDFHEARSGAVVIQRNIGRMRDMGNRRDVLGPVHAAGRAASSGSRCSPARRRARRRIRRLRRRGAGASGASPAGP